MGVKHVQCRENRTSNEGGKENTGESGGNQEKEISNNEEEMNSKALMEDEH